MLTVLANGELYAPEPRGRQSVLLQTGGSGEEGFASRTPEIQLSEIAPWGITTVVGCLGVDATTRTPTNLLARVKGLREEGLSAFLYTGRRSGRPGEVGRGEQPGAPSGR